jgi:hypothetical protein
MEEKTAICIEITLKNQGDKRKTVAITVLGQLEREHEHDVVYLIAAVNKITGLICTKLKEYATCSGDHLDETIASDPVFTIIDWWFLI